MRALFTVFVIQGIAALAFGQPASLTAGEQAFTQLCASCHGSDAQVGDKGPALAGNRALRGRSEAPIRDILRNGTPTGMPAFSSLADEQARALAVWVRSLNASAFDSKPEGDSPAGEAIFFGKGGCAACHMVAGRGHAVAPDLSSIGRSLTTREVEQAIAHPRLRKPLDCAASACFQPGYTAVTVTLRDQAVLHGFLRQRGVHDLQLETFDGRWHFLLDTEYSDVRPEEYKAPSADLAPKERQDLLAYLSTRGGIALGPPEHAEPVAEADLRRIQSPERGEWATYNGDYSGNRSSALDQINLQNAGRLRLQWTYSLNFSPLEVTPLVVDGLMYVTAPNRVCALDPRSGREVWCYSRPRTDPAKVSADATRGATRGVAVLGDRVFFITDNAHLLCLNRLTGAPMWEVVTPEIMAERYGGTSAPLVVGDLVIVGVSGGDENVRGFVSAYHADTGKPAWRFWPVPRPGEAGSETWRGNALAKDGGGGATWLSGSYDPELKLLYWATGQPFPATDGSQREGDNLYTDCVVALDITTGKLRWYFQFTPHDLHDWDATEPLVLVNTRFQGRERKLLLQANRNGFYYALDRTNGEFLLGKAFAKKVTWASGIGPDGRPQLLPANFPTRAGVKACPAVRGATNWYSTAFHPDTRLFYVMTVEDCSTYRVSQEGGYGPARDPNDPPGKLLRALDVETGKVAWEIRQFGSTEANYSGVLATAGGLVFYGETGGAFAAVDARSGKPLWRFDTNQIWKGSPMTYLDHGKQYVAIAGGNAIYSFALDSN